MSHVLNAHVLEPLLARIRRKELAVLVALGDSNTCNASFTAGFKQWPELLHSELRIACVSQRILMVNAGMCGDTARGGLARLDSDVLRFQPSLTMVAFGSNDAPRVTPAQFAEHMDAMVDRLQCAGSLVLLRTSPPVMELQPSPPHIWTNDEVHWRLMDDLRAMAERRGLPLVDHHRWWRDLEEQGKLHIADLMHDCVHPNAAGHQLLARQMGQAFGLPEKLHWERGEGEAPGA